MAKIMIVDDAAFMRMMIKDNLKKAGYTEFVEAGDGEQALIKYEEEKPGMVIMDITMPVMDGIQALSAIKQADPKAKVVMCSAMGQEGMVKESILSGAKTFIVKPFKEDFLYRTLSKVLNI